jgi:hypothetical protein
VVCGDSVLFRATFILTSSYDGFVLFLQNQNISFDFPLGFVS